MSVTRSSFLTAVSSFELKSKRLERGFYHSGASELLCGFVKRESVLSVGQILVQSADWAFSIRDMDAVNRAGQILRSLEDRNLEKIGTYYTALATLRHQPEQFRGQIENLACSASLRYRARSLLSLGAINFVANDYKEAAKLYEEAARLGSEVDLWTYLQGTKTLAFMRSIAGDHGGAVKLLTGIYPMAKQIAFQYPVLLRDIENSLAIELSEVGEVEAAARLAEVVVASPAASAYPEWLQTREEIKMKQRRPSCSSVSLSRKAPHLSLVPNKEHTTTTRPENSLLPYQEHEKIILLVRVWMAGKKDDLFQEPITPEQEELAREFANALRQENLREPLELPYPELIMILFRIVKGRQHDNIFFGGILLEKLDLVDTFLKSLLHTILAAQSTS